MFLFSRGSIATVRRGDHPDLLLHVPAVFVERVASRLKPSLAPINRRRHRNLDVRAVLGERVWLLSFLRSGVPWPTDGHGSAPV